MNQPLFARVLIVGVGLIGGSLALAARRAGAVQEVRAWERTPEILARAHALGIISAPPADIAAACAAVDLVVLAAPVAQTGAILQSLLPHLPQEALISDVGSTKQDVAEAARSVLGAQSWRFIPAHPIAGREVHGPEAALADLFQGRKVVLTPLPENRAQDIARLRALWQACGAQVQILSPQQHDQIFAAVSHLPHLLAYALVEMLAARPERAQFFNYAASGFRDFTRIAASSPEMWRDIALANRSALLQEMDAYQSSLQHLRQLLEQADGPAMHDLFARAQSARQEWQQSQANPLPNSGSTT
ncbi:prephenate dehydrogenase/arogenate dehydrogenase family protein [Massilia sp. W12]|uniref:prephenate dehydrogenase n=1 Tax=Massilia sp. W12 TaxID=3126507 RepID=UPI0030CE7BBC